CRHMEMAMNSQALESHRARVGVIFPGQGSQAVGMGGDVAAKYPAAADLFTRASKVLKYDLSALTQEGPDEKLRETRYSQPAIFVTNCALYAAAGELNPIVSAGHSFGELCSLTIAGALDFEDAVRLVHERALAMQHAADRASGAMAAVLGLEPQALRDISADVRKTGLGRVQLANFNAPGQIVISGDFEAVKHAGERAIDAGAKRVIPLNVSGAWHSELMAPAGEGFSPHVRTANFRLPKFTVISNVDAEPYRDVATIVDHVVRSVTDEVLWHDTAMRLLEERLDLVVEFGANAVLAPLVKRLPGAPRTLHVGDAAGIERLHAMLAHFAPA
ncbi:MAG TPA: ACP S-malonyltransferase, partial [Candidatus Acidoferrales bacterium]|nr:ACP S-malonyltransferase [Candidatus Acidoferrales bacterium]